VEDNNPSCNFLYTDVIEASEPYNPLYPRIKSEARNRFYSIYFLFVNNIFPKKKTEKTASDVERAPSTQETILNLQPGEWVQVRSLEEISETLDEKGKFMGLYFMPEMGRYCGKTFKVFKKVKIIKLESTGELRKLRSPSVFLEGVYCDGEKHGGCDRACFHFWREAWLKRVSNQEGIGK
jgi:hypothetical protein